MAVSGKAWHNASAVVAKTIATTLKGVQKEVSTRAYRASNELRNSSLYVLRGQRSGKKYLVPFTKQQYTASAPDESPAVRTGVFRLSWGTHVRVEKNGVHFRAVSTIESNVKAGNYLLGEILENGTKRMKPRPFKQKIIDRALPKITELYNKSYKV
jgi:hypothetical protein